jgi:glycosyltransferase involved in cell wall biosynthesis
MAAQLSASPPVSVVVLTHDEERNIGDCLKSLASFEDVSILDSGSSDGTTAIAKSLSARVYCNPFTTFAAQRNWAIDHVPARHSWVLHLDADERMTPALTAEIARELADNPAHGGYFIPSKLMFAGRWLKHAGDYPTYQVRLFHRERLRFIDYGHGQRESTACTLGRLSEPYLHEAFNKGLDLWFAKHAAYAKLEAQQALQEHADAGSESWKSLLSADRTVRRRALKRLSYCMPWRSSLRWLYMVLAKRAFLDGRQGLVYARMMTTYEAMVDVQLSLLRLNGDTSSASTPKNTE